METKREHRRLDLTEQEWQRLDDVAEEISARPRRGKNAYQPDWRALVRGIARGEIVVSEKDPRHRCIVPPDIEAEWQRQKDEWQKSKSSYRQLSILEAEAA